MSSAQTTATVTAAPGVACSTLPAAFQATAASRAEQPALIAFGEDRELSWSEYATAVREVAGGLASLGIGRGDTVAVMAPNSPEFHIVDMAALHLAATPFSIYLTSAPDQISYLFGNAENSVVVVQRRFLDVIAHSEAPALRYVVVLDPGDDLPSSVGAAQVLSLDNLRTRTPAGFDYAATWSDVSPDDVATLIYTSGTTGAPKGVELTHANLMFVMHTCNQRFPFAVDGAAISYLPTAHAADRVFSHYLATVTGWPITTVGDASQVFAAVAAAHPSWFLGVPRIWEKLRAALLARFSTASDTANGPNVLAAVDAATSRVQLQQSRSDVPADMEAAVARVDAEIFAGLRDQLGFDRVALLMTGAAPIAPAVHEFFLALGLPLQEGFGMSETGALGFTNIPTDIRVGKVGLAQPGTEAKLAADGELLLRGAHVMRGYRKDPEKTAEAIDADGWLYTGDIATIDDDGWVTIVDRKKELIINAAGKNMSPVNIEGKLKSADPLIGQACVIGDRRPYNVALLVLDPDAARTFATAHGYSDTSPAAIVNDPDLIAAVDAAVETANSQLSRIEQIKAYRILDDEWLPDSDELTPTMKLKRRGVASKYAKVIQEIYSASQR
ncbi:AMP-dependent synthetase/ligase [Gordonia sp. HY442]|uniref:AMP-dependent synthetase/ligase n=1 Tax=Gordonia zhenghanii TaxID=2911516 RepID=UPI001F2B1304|nr:AMP-dependent synthetase/ligase [Gordonia zhenghanii]MCF8601992.1 AMP-dependent synthetase/ligase [Gordonia zhenghanii]MCF8602060.1 AMP-dependent synthetase/ligase [Gordonia zhenghanii]